MAQKKKAKAPNKKAKAKATPKRASSKTSKKEVKYVYDFGKKTDGDAKQRELLGGKGCLLYTSPSPRDGLLSRMPSSA